MGEFGSRSNCQSRCVAQAHVVCSYSKKKKKEKKKKKIAASQSLLLKKKRSQSEHCPNEVNSAESPSLY